MDVILLERVEKLGLMGQVVKVRPGYARNYLLPQKKALRATKSNLAFYERQKAHLEAHNLELRKEAEFVAEKMKGLSVIITRQAGETGVMYGSVSARDIADMVAEAGFKIDRRQVAIDHPIKTLGLFQVRVILHPEVSVSVTVNVARSQEEAQLQAQRGGMITAAQLAAEEAAAEAAAAAAAAAAATEDEDEG
ncbi:MAG TPA: 50S ribosomal protein L9 [Azospirillaceae bacterium]|nr:50S ribosomal protein L9 [Azospirillaceae bacterium]